MSPILKTNGKAMHIYVAGPYSASNARSVEQNLTNAIVAGVEILRRGDYPYILHLNYYVYADKKKGLFLLLVGYFDWGLAWVDRFDAILFLGMFEGALI